MLRKAGGMTTSSTLNQKPLIIFGAGQIAEVACAYFADEGGREVVAFVVDPEFRQMETLLGLPVLALDEAMARYSPDQVEVFVAMSFRGVNRPRAEKCRFFEALGYTLASHVSPDAHVWKGFQVQPNCLIMEGNVIQPFVAIGRNCILWSGNHVGHHTVIDDDVFIASHAVISGNCHIGERTFIGVNATLRDNIIIGAGSVIGAGALVLGSAPEGSVFMGEATPISRVPAHRLRTI